jgi:N utilization substance protein A
MMFEQIKIVIDKDAVRFEEEGAEPLAEDDPRALLPRYNEERHIMIDEARLLKKNVEVGEELVFPLEMKDDFGRIAAQTAKQVIMQSLREAEREQTAEEFGAKEGTIVSGVVERIDRGLTFVDLGKATAIMPIEEQLQNERLIPGSRIKAYLYSIEDTPRGLSIRISRSHPKFLVELFKSESSEIAEGVVEIVSVAREPGSRSKISVKTNDEKVDPIGACVGQRGVRVNAITSELHGEKIDIIEYSADPKEYIKKALSPAKPTAIEINDETNQAKVTVLRDEQSLAIGKGGQNVRLAAKLTGYKIDIEGGDDENTSEERSEGDFGTENN